MGAAQAKCTTSEVRPRIRSRLLAGAARNGATTEPSREWQRAVPDADMQ